jgi:hypothetical protein
MLKDVGDYMVVNGEQCVPEKLNKYSVDRLFKQWHKELVEA